MCLLGGTLLFQKQYFVSKRSIYIFMEGNQKSETIPTIVKKLTNKVLEKVANENA